MDSEEYGSESFESEYSVEESQVQDDICGKMYEKFILWWTTRDFLISHQSSFKDNWDYLIMIAACWNVFMLPI